MELYLKRKILFLALMICIVFSIFIAETLAASTLDHDCTGKDCPFCLCIEMAHNFLKNLKLAGLAVFLAVCLAFLSQIPPKYTVLNACPCSLILLKVRLNS